jgi:hypothetical protein
VAEVELLEDAEGTSKLVEDRLVWGYTASEERRLERVYTERRHVQLEFAHMRTLANALVALHWCVSFLTGVVVECVAALVGSDGCLALVVSREATAMRIFDVLDRCFEAVGHSDEGSC